jgi:hypothetical protein
MNKNSLIDLEPTFRAKVTSILSPVSFLATPLPSSKAFLNSDLKKVKLKKKSWSVIISTPKTFQVLKLETKLAEMYGGRERRNVGLIPEKEIRPGLLVKIYNQLK